MFEMQVIDFHARFMEDFMKWCQEHQEIANDEGKMDDVFFDMYEAWMDSPKKWLDGQTPRGVFEAVDDPRMLVSALVAYVKEDVELPDPLVDCILEKKQEVYPILYQMLFADEPGDEEMSKDELLDVQAHAISLISEMQMDHPLPRYLEIIQTLEEDCEYAEHAIEALEQAGDAIKEELLACYSNAQGFAKACAIELLSRLTGDERIFAILMDELRADDMSLQFVASCLERFGDERALPALRELLGDPGICYSEFVELKNAVESLSGEEVEERDFTGDAVYDYLAQEREEDES